MPLSPGTRLGPYEVLGPIGAGGMGEVYRARDARLKRDVAIKVLPSNDPDRLWRFEHEAQAAGSLNHPNILAIYDVGTHDGVSYIVSELLAGETLRTHAGGAALPPRLAVNLTIQIVQGLAAAHQKKIVHRDLKPENLFVTEDGRIKILDFGLAKLTAPPENRAESQANVPTVAAATEVGTVLGTAGYMSPEQVRGEAADERADIFAVGAVLYELLSGRRAFTGGSSIETMSAILRDDPPELAIENGDISPALDRLVRRCLAKTPVNRFQSARDLEFALADVATELGLPQTIARAPRPRFRPITWVAGAGVAAVLLLALLVPRIVRQVDVSEGAAQVQKAGSGIASLAVLPLQNLSKDPEQEYFSDGMTEALIADLARVSGLRVISRTSAMTYKAAMKPLPQIARELNVDVVVEGSIMRSGDRVRITAQLIDAKTDRHLWANTYERDLHDVLSLQSEVARAIAREIRITLTPQEEAHLALARPVNPLAHEAYLRGRYRLGKGIDQTVKQAIDDFNQAIGIDPGYAPPYAGLSAAYAVQRFTSYAPPHTVMPQAKAAAAKAVQLDPSLAEGHVSMAVVLMSYEFDWPGAERELKQAIALSPNLADAHDFYALYLAGMGRHDEARAEVERALELDPLAITLLNDAGWVYYLARRYDRTIELNRKAIDLDPNFWRAHSDLGVGYERVGRFAEAVASLLKARELDANPSSILENLAGAYAAWGKQSEARKVLAELTKQASQHYVCPFEVATVHAGLGDKEATLEWLEKGYQARADCMAWTGSDPKLDALRGDPRFEDLKRRIGLSR